MLPGDTTVKDVFANTPLAGASVITPQDAVQSRINGAFSLPENTRTSLTPEQIRAFAMPDSVQAASKTGRLPADSSQVSLQDFKLPASSSTSAGKSKTDAYQSEIASLNQRTAALKETYDAQSKLNPLDADYAQKVTAIEQATSTLSAAQKAGAAVGKELSDVNQLLYGDLSMLTPEAQKQALAIRAAALGYADADAKLKALKDTQDAAKQSLQDMLELEKDVAGGILSDIRTALEDGKVTWKEWGDIAVNALNKIADKLQDTLLDQFFKSNPFGFFGSLFGGGVAGGGASVGAGIGAGAVKAAPAGLVSAGNLKTPDLPALGALRGGQNDASHVVVSVDDDGAIRAYVARQGQRTKVEVLHASQASLDQYRRGQQHQDIENHLKNRRVVGR
jgi:hypothetical protein